MFGKKVPGNTKAHKRFRRIENYEVLNWADTVGTGIARSLNQYRKEGGEVTLLEAHTAATQLLAAIEVLQERQ